jgi:hypothetical protein
MVVDALVRIPTHSSPILLLDCPICVMLTHTLPLAIIEPTLLDPNTSVYVNKLKDNISTSGSTWSDILLCKLLFGIGSYLFLLHKVRKANPMRKINMALYTSDPELES